MKTNFTPGAKISTRLENRLKVFLPREAFALEGEIKQTITNSSPSGRTYRIGRISSGAKKLAGLGLRSYKTKKGNKRFITGARIYRASAAGQPPGNRTGGNLNAIKAQPAGRLRYRVIASKAYAAALDSPQGLNRPFFATTVVKFRPGFVRRADIELKQL